MIVALLIILLLLTMLNLWINMRKKKSKGDFYKLKFFIFYNIQQWWYMAQETPKISKIIESQHHSLTTHFDLIWQVNIYILVLIYYLKLILLTFSVFINYYSYLEGFHDVPLEGNFNPCQHDKFYILQMVSLKDLAVSIKV